MTIQSKYQAKLMRVTKKDVQLTKSYNNLSKTLKKEVVTRNNIKESIERAVNYIINNNYKEWYLNTKTKHHNILIIDEIIDKYYGKRN